MLKLFKRIFGDPKSISETVESVTNSFDKLNFTKQERAVEHNKAVSDAMNMTVRWMETTQGQNLARRMIALSITFSWLLLLFVRITLSVVSVFQKSSAVTDAASILRESTEEMTPAVMLILGFYFAGPHLKELVGGAVARFNKK